MTTNYCGVHKAYGRLRRQLNISTAGYGLQTLRRLTAAARGANMSHHQAAFPTQQAPAIYLFIVNISYNKLGMIRNRNCFSTIFFINVAFS